VCKIEQESVIYHLGTAATHLEKAFTQTKIEVQNEHFPVELAQKWCDFFTLLIGNIIHSETDTYSLKVKEKIAPPIKAKENVLQDGA
jgi:hypothetical protein